MNRQLAIEFLYRAALGRADFLPSACNAAALGWIERWPDWPTGILVLYGPPGSGKSHLAALWCQRSGARLLPGDTLGDADPHQVARIGAIAVDNAERAPEEALLHLFNCIREAGTSLLVVAQQAPMRWPLALPDLASRLRAAPAVGIDLPDDALLAAVLVKHCADRQLSVGPEVIEFLIRRIERSFAAASAVVARLDRLSLSTRRRVTIAMVRQMLGEAAEPV